MTEAYDWQVYVLKDPSEGLVRYVGISCKAETRFWQHVMAARGDSCTRHHLWMRRLLDRCLLPKLEVIEAGTGVILGAQAERKWIKYYREMYRDDECPNWLLNSSRGGEGLGSGRRKKLKVTS